MATMKPFRIYRNHWIELLSEPQSDGTWLCWVKIDGDDRIDHNRNGCLLPPSETNQVDAERKALDSAKRNIDFQEWLEGQLEPQTF